jgi:superfamily II DNA or RNA helicase
LRSRYVVGLSATLNRRDGLECAVHWLLGPTIVHEERGRTKVDVDIHYYTNSKTQVEHKWPYGQNKGKPHYQKILDDMIKDKKRNSFMIDWVLETLNEPKRKIVVQSKLKNHLGILYELLLEKLDMTDMNATTVQESKNIVSWTNDQGKTVRLGYYTGDYKQDDCLNALKCDVIFATCQMMEEGVDEPSIDTVLFATPIGDVTQTSGRALRLMPEKNVPKLMYMFDNFSIWKRMGNKALRYFKSQQYNIQTI